jgi:hypothetical protein
MTFAGKIFVMVNVALSLFWVVMAFGLYATSMDWSDKGAKDNQPAGILAAKITEINDLKQLQAPTEESWREARRELRQREEARRADRQFYAAQFMHNRDTATLANPARIAKRREPLAAPADREDLRNTVAELGKDGRPVMEPAKDAIGQNLQAQVVYDKALDSAREENKKVLVKLDEEIKKDIFWTNKLLDDPPRKGLRTQLVEEKLKREGVTEELRIVEPLLVNTIVESDLILKRLESIQGRILELESYIKKRKMDVALLKR